jgi:hypothetical protein
MNREDWLTAMVDALRPAFDAAGKPIPARVHVSVGFPSRSALSPHKQRVGECWHPGNSADGASQIFISPIVGDGLTAADILTHELCHAALPAGTAHNKTFAKLAKAMGLEGKPTATHAGAELKARLNGFIAAIGPYPQPALTAGESKKKKQGTRMLKVACEVCGYTARTTQSWLDLAGAPICPTDKVTMETL